MYHTTQLYPAYIVNTIHIDLSARQTVTHNHYLVHISFKPSGQNNPKRIEPSLCYSVGRNLYLTWRGNVAIYTYRHNIYSYYACLCASHVWNMTSMTTVKAASTLTSVGWAITESVGARSNWEANCVLLYWQKSWRANSLLGRSWGSKFTGCLTFSKQKSQVRAQYIYVGYNQWIEGNTLAYYGCSKSVVQMWVVIIVLLRFFIH